MFTQYKSPVVLHRPEITSWSIPSRSTASQELCRWFLSEGCRIELNLRFSQNRQGQSAGKGTWIKTGNAYSHKAVSDASKSMECHQNLALRHRSLAGLSSRSPSGSVQCLPGSRAPADVVSSGLLSFSDTFSCLLMYKFCTVLLKDEVSLLETNVPVWPAALCL